MQARDVVLDEQRHARIPRGGGGDGRGDAGSGVSGAGAQHVGQHASRAVRAAALLQEDRGGLGAGGARRDPPLKGQQLAAVGWCFRTLNRDDFDDETVKIAMGSLTGMSKTCFQNFFSNPYLANCLPLPGSQDQASLEAVLAKWTSTAPAALNAPQGGLVILDDRIRFGVRRLLQATTDFYMANKPEICTCGEMPCERAHAHAGGDGGGGGAGAGADKACNCTVCSELARRMMTEGCTCAKRPYVVDDECVFHG